MGFIAKLAKKGVFGLGGALLGGVIGGKKRPTPQPLAVTRDEARAAIEDEDELRRRRGAAADIISGRRGAEAAAGSIGRLIVGS